MIIWAPISWSGLLLVGLFVSLKYIPNQMTQIYIGLGIAFFMIIKRIISKNKDMEDDFRRTYKDYLIE